MNAPRLRDDMRWFLDAFYELDTCREHLTPIPWLAIHTYAQAYNLNSKELDDLIYFTGELDSAYMQLLAKKQKNGAKST